MDTSVLLSPLCLFCLKPVLAPTSSCFSSSFYSLLVLVLLLLPLPLLLVVVVVVLLDVLLLLPLLQMQ